MRGWIYCISLENDTSTRGPHAVVVGNNCTLPQEYCPGKPPIYGIAPVTDETAFPCA
jgi:hypothetical protein